jgi:hypothetical protein
MADEEPVMPDNVLLVRVTRTADEPPSGLNTIGAMARPGEKTRQSHSFLSSEQIHIYRRVKTGGMRCKSRTWHKKDGFIQRKDNGNEAWGG